MSNKTFYGFELLYLFRIYLCNNIYSVVELTLFKC